MTLYILLLASFATLSFALSQTCSNPAHYCDDGMLCVKDKFCVGEQIYDCEACIFSCGIATEFVSGGVGSGEAAMCFERITGDISDFVLALGSWERGEYEDSLKHFYSAVENIQYLVKNCVSSQSQQHESFWDELWHGFEALLSALCPECEVYISEAEFVIEGVDIIEDWVAMYHNCYADASQDEMVDCGAAFGDAVQRVLQVVRRKRALESH